MRDKGKKKEYQSVHNRLSRVEVEEASAEEKDSR